MRTVKHGTASGYTNGKCRCDECKRAHREQAAKYKAANPEKVNAHRRERYAVDPGPTQEATRRWREANPDKIKQYERTKYLRHRDRIREYARVHYLLNREAYIERAAKWKQENPERVKEHARNGRERHRERYNAYGREHAREMRKADPQKYRDRFNAWAASPRGRAWFKANAHARRGAPFTEEALEWLESLVDPLCTYCGSPADSIDHIIPVTKGGTSDRENLTPACRSCNSKKRTMSLAAFLKRLEKENA